MENNVIDKLRELPKSVPSWSVGLLAGAAAAAAAGFGAKALVDKGRGKAAVNAPQLAAADDDAGATLVAGAEPAPQAVQPPMEDVVADVETFIQENCPYLELNSNPDTRYYITQSLNIGRYEHNDIQLPDNTMGVSRLHCRIFIKGGKYYVVNLGENVQTVVDGKPVDNSKQAQQFFDYELKDGSTLAVGKYEFTFRQKPPVEAQAPIFADCDSTVVIE